MGGRLPGMMCTVALAAIVLAPPGTEAAGPGLRALTQLPGEVDAVTYAGRDRIYATRGRLFRLVPGAKPVEVGRFHGYAEQLVGSSTRVALVASSGRARRLLAGPPAGPLRTVRRCSGRRPEIPSQLIALSGDLLAEGLNCRAGVFRGSTAVRVHGSGPVGSIPAPAGQVVVGLAGAPGSIALSTQSATQERGATTVSVHAADTGDTRYTVGGLAEPFGFFSVLAVQADGSAVFCDSGDRLAWASPRSPSAHRIRGLRCPEGSPKLAAGRIAYFDQAEDRFLTADLAGRSRTLIRHSGGLPFDWDGERLLVRGLACGHDFLGEMLRTAPSYRGRPCRVRVVRVRRRAKSASVLVTLACRPGCVGALDLMLGRTAAGSRSVNVRLNGDRRRTYRIRADARARRRLARYRTVPFTASVSFTNPASGAGVQDISERSGTLRGDGERAYPRERPMRSD